jgi:LysM repeat protein
VQVRPLSSRGDLSADTISSTFNCNVPCDSTLPTIAFGGYFPDEDDLNALCTSECLQSLDLFRNSQQASCEADTMTLSGVTYPITATIDALLWTYNFTCRRDSVSGDFCAPQFDTWANGNASDLGCSECVLGTYQLQLSNALGYDDELAGNFSSLASSCHATNYPITSPPSNSLSRTTTVSATTYPAVPEKSCYGTYTIRPGDDCHTISNSQKVSTNNLLYLNNLQGGCANFPGPGQTLCMPRSCDVHTVQANDTCRKITNSGSFTASQLISWNIDISRGCDNLDQLVGMEVCISSPEDGGLTTGTTYSQTRSPQFINQFINPCVGGTTTGPPSCYATTYPTAPRWTFPAVPKASDTASSVDTTTYELPLVTAYPPHSAGTANGSLTNTTSYAVSPVTAYPSRSTGVAALKPGYLYWIYLGLLWIQINRIDR